MTQPKDTSELVARIETTRQQRLEMAEIAGYSVESDGVDFALELAAGALRSQSDELVNAYRIIEQRWQPIETAPKDGTMLLLAIEPVDEGYLLGWNPSRTVSIVVGWWGYSEWTSHLMEEGTADTEGHSSPYQITISPTHWQPLPPPPAALNPSREQS